MEPGIFDNRASSQTTLQNRIYGVGSTRQVFPVASANPRYFMNPAARAITRAHAAPIASSPPLAANAEANTVGEEVGVNTLSCSHLTDTILRCWFFALFLIGYWSVESEIGMCDGSHEQMHCSSSISIDEEHRGAYTRTTLVPTGRYLAQTMTRRVPGLSGGHHIRYAQHDHQRCSGIHVCSEWVLGRWLTKDLCAVAPIDRPVRRHHCMLRTLFEDLRDLSYLFAGQYPHIMSYCLKLTDCIDRY